MVCGKKIYENLRQVGRKNNPKYNTVTKKEEKKTSPNKTIR